MNAKKKITAICGSTKAGSTNLSFIKAIGEIVADTIELDIFTGLAELPHFNPDLDTENSPAAVTAFRDRLRSSDGILICTPEYAMGVPGSLKNAIDWTVSSCEFSHKPTALITASSVGQKGHAALLETLYIIEAKIPQELQLLIPYAQTKISKENKITDAATLKEVNGLIEAFEKIIHHDE
ncbi:MAG: NADPH-dependent reductase [Bacteroidetes bacterium]|jgi:NAD(P)H-dependent FMN reductase|nr:NADPH-dependent reductase [Bacteroidota bacterium]